MLHNNFYGVSEIRTIQDTLIQNAVYETSKKINEMQDNAFIEICCNHGITNINDIYALNYQDRTIILRKSDNKKIGIIYRPTTRFMDNNYKVDVKYKSYPN